MADPISTKPAYLSKTLWMNLILAALAMVAPPVKAAVESHPEITVAVFSVLNMLLRMFTKTGIQLG